MPFVNAVLCLMFIAVWAMVGQILASDRREQGTRSANLRHTYLYWDE
jgi:hypothetical protein